MTDSGDPSGRPPDEQIRSWRDAFRAAARDDTAPERKRTPAPKADAESDAGTEPTDPSPPPQNDAPVAEEQPRPVDDDEVEPIALAPEPPEPPSYLPPGGTPPGRDGGDDNGDEPPLTGPRRGRRWNPMLAVTTQRPVAVLTLVVAVCVFGFVSLQQLPLELLPKFSYPRLTVQTDFPTASPETVETEVSEPIEQGVGSLPGLVRRSSVSRAELSEVTLEFKWGTDLADAAGEVRQKLDRVRLPGDAEAPLVLRYDPTLEPIVRLALVDAELAGGQMSREAELRRRLELRELAENQLKDRLERLDGVAAVNVLGGSEPIIEVRVDSEALQQHDLSMDQVVRTLQDQNVELAAGIIEEGNREFLVRTRNRFSDVAEIGEIQVTDGVPLRTVAEITLTERDPEIRTRFNGAPSVEIEMLKEADANLVVVARGIWNELYGEEQGPTLRNAARRLLEDGAEVPTFDRATVEQAGDEARNPYANQDPGASRSPWGSRVTAQELDLPLAALLPPSVELTVLSDQSFFIEDAINEVVLTAILGGILAVLILFIFLRRLGQTLIVGLAIPVSVIATFTPMKLGDVSLNLISFGGIALGLGMLVDNAIVVLESIGRCREEGDSPMRAAIRGVSEVLGAIIASTMTTVAVFLPVVLVEGVAGQIFGQQALTVVFSLVVSLLVAIFVIPVLAALSFGPSGRRTSIRDLLEPRFAGAWARWWRGIARGHIFRPVMWVFRDVDRKEPPVAAADPTTDPAGIDEAEFVETLPDGRKRLVIGPTQALIREPQPAVSDPDPISLIDRETGDVLVRFSPEVGESAWRDALAAQPEQRAAAEAAESAIEQGARLPVWARWVLSPVLLPLAAAWVPIAVVLTLVERVAATVVEAIWRYIFLVGAAVIAGGVAVAARGAYIGLGTILRGPAAAFDAGWTGFREFYRSVLRWALAHTATVLVAAAVATVAALGVFQTLDGELVPRLRQGEFAVQFSLAEGRTLAQTEAALADVEAVLADDPAVERFTIIAGEAREPGGERIRRENLARVTVVLVKGAGPADEARVRAAIRDAEAAGPDLRDAEFSVPTLLSLSTPIEVEIYGTRLDQIRTAAEQIEARMRSMALREGADAPLFGEIRSTARRGNPEVRIAFDREKLRERNLDPLEAATRLKEKLEGDVATDFTYGSERIDVLVELDERDIPTLNEVLDLRLAQGLTYRDVITLDRQEGPAEIRRRDNFRLAIISAGPSPGIALSDAAARLQAAIDQMPLQGVTVRLGGQMQEMEESFGYLVLAAALAVFLVYVVMAVQFESLLQPFIIMMTVPLAFVGVVFALAILGLPLSVIVIIGAIVLAGIVVNNAIVLIDRINYNRARGMELNRAILEGGTVRLRPIIITTLTTVLGLLPLTGWPWITWVTNNLLGLNILGEGQEVRAPMAITVVVGLTAATVLTLVVVPVIYRLVAATGRRIGGEG
jgi:multidrug efflux pump subunit AcrB